jgi:hypothetical protein
MTERRGDEGFSVAPQRIGGGGEGGGGRGRRLGVLAAIVAAVAFVVAIGIGPRLAGRPNLDLSFFATPVPTRTPIPLSTPTRPPTFNGPTPLPIMIRPTDVRLAGSIGMVSDTFRVLDLETGLTKSGPLVQPYRDAVVPDGSGGWLCLCFRGSLDAPEPNDLLEVLRIAPDGTAASIGSSGLAGADIRDRLGTSGDIDLTDDHRLGLVTRAEPTDAGAGWTVLLGSVDTDRATLVDQIELGDLPKPALPPGTTPAPMESTDPGGGPFPDQEVYVDGPHVLVAPTGRLADVWTLAQRITSSGVAGTERRGWRVRLGADGTIEETRPEPALDAMPPFCATAGFISDDRLAWACPRFSFDPTVAAPPAFEIGALNADGTLAFAGPRPDGGILDGQVIFDRANDAIVVWSPAELAISRVDGRSGATVTSKLSAAVDTAAGVRDGSGDRPPDWRAPGSSVSGFAATPIAAEPGGTRLFLAGYDNEVDSGASASVSLGIFVVDGSTLAQLDRWAPATMYQYLSVPLPGYVAAAGAPNIDATGREAPWQGSLTLHRIDDGAIVARYGQVGDGPPVVIAP